MDRYMKLFILMSLVYFAVGAFLGVLMGMGLGADRMRFAHIHLNLLGFMAMMIYGVGYFILPRFNARVLKWPGLLPVHFWSANVGLVGMTVTWTISSFWFAVFGLIQAFSIIIFAGNLVASVFASEEAAPAKGQVKEKVEIRPEMKVADIVEKWPQARDVLVEAGLKGLSDSTHLEQARKVGVTLSMAAKRHGVDEAQLISRLTEAITGEKGALQAAQGGGSAEGMQITRDAIIGEVLKKYPRTEEVFKRFYGEGCFSCPGQAFETIAQSALMHNVKEEEILDALNKAL